MNAADYYYATYDFKDELGKTGFDIDFIDVYAASDNCYAKIISEFDGHSNVLDVFDNNSGSAVAFSHYYDVIRTNGTVEFWWGYDGSLSYQHYLYVYFFEGGSDRVRVIFGYQAIGQIVNWNGTIYHTIALGLSINTFYHMKIIFDDSVNIFDFYINEQHVGNFDYYSNSTVGISGVRFGTRSTGVDYHHWFDAWGELWDFEYNLGDNKYPYLNMINILTPVFSLLFLIFLMIIMIFLYMKVKIWLVILVLFLFSLIIGVYSLSLEYIPFNPYFSILFILFQSVFFLKISLETYEIREK